ncbi:MAG: radical SAM/SPASM domain-containing protein [Myxococcota bacterium]
MPPALPGSYLVLETTNTCSLACVHCSVSEAGHPHHAKTGFLPVSTADAVFDDLRAVGARFDTLILFWLGEPLVHPGFGPIYQSALRAASAGVFGKVELHTNATHLGAPQIRLALNLAPVPQVWHLSLDAATRGTYRAIKGVDRFDAVEANVGAFLDAKAARGARWPRPVFQLIVSDRNAAEVPAFRERWEKACRSRGLPVRSAAQEVPPGDDAVVFFRQLDASTPAEQERQNAVYRATMARLGLVLPRAERSPTTLPADNAGVCACFWKSPVVGWDGRVTTCTRDNRFENVLGNVNDTPFSQLWWGETMRRRRGNVAKADYSELSVCRTCFIPRSANATDITPAEIEAHG